MRRLVILASVLLATVAWADSGVDGFLAYLERELAQDPSAAEAVVRALENAPTVATADRERLLDGLAGVLSTHGQSALVPRLRALPLAGVSTLGAEPLAFPGDHGNHPHSFLEWWYFSGNLESGGRRFGFELSFFKTAVAVHYVHAAVTDVARGAHPWQRRWVRPRDASFGEGRLAVAMAGCTAREDAGGRIALEFDTGGDHPVRARLSMKPERAPMIVNGDGVIDMPEGSTSRYYSVTRLTTSGTLEFPGRELVNVNGRSWFDHQWGNFVVFFRPWDWFSLQMDDGSDYNLFHFRPALGFNGRTCVNVLRPDGKLEVSRDLGIERRAWWTSPASGGHFVTRWSLTSPSAGESFDVSTPVPDQEMPRTGGIDIPPAYWEGAIDVVRTRTGAGGITRGVGYCEHMPYRAERSR